MALLRKPSKAVAKCEYPGCKFVRIFWQADSEYSAEFRAEASLKAHQHEHEGQFCEIIPGRTA